ncbi:C4-dicarboxylate transporter DctQ subunit [Bacillus oleivorans]|uniref:C4-dicarboxylate transporter DctQ subunit n=1 Tax=Bacillus oleivorans TaxID=1448271 RepID=A0A285D8F1_9BACI|nr:TRAP transporter small permease [Bacillus oleivorans]SNX75558.1 C4-dicarboxylate transporter DctQ subunit [Bacillus oleivorans]
MERITKLETLLMVPLFLIGMCVCIFGVFMRYILNNPVHWIEEIFALTIVWSIFIGFSTALKNNNHIALDLLYAFLPKRVQRFLDLVGYTIGMMFSIFFIYYGFQMVFEAYRVGGVSLEAKIPLWIESMIMPIGGLLLFLAYLEKLINYFSIKNKKIEEEKNHGIFTG